MTGFKAIVVGAGPVGLVLAHALQASGIDFVLVEQRAQVPPATAFGLFLWPQIIRVFHQLGLLDTIEKIAQPMIGSSHQSQDGNIFSADEGYSLLETLYGYPVMLFDRGKFGQALLETLNDWEKLVKTNKRVTNIVTHSDGVKVEFADASSEEGSIVIGCDGVWSTVRDHICQIAPEGLFDLNPNPFEAPYTGLFGRAPRPKGILPGKTINVYHTNRQIQVFTSEHEAHIIAYQRIPNSREKTYFNNNDAEAAAKPWLDVPVSEGVTFGDLWRDKIAGGGANFDEGVLRWWHWDRMVLAGDAAHKMSPIRGAGACCGIEDAISLVNSLKKALRSTPNPKRTDLRHAFAAYQSEREGVSRLWTDISRLCVDLGTAATGPKLKTMNVADMRLFPLIADGPVLDGFALEDERQGLMPWKRRSRARKTGGEAKARL